MANAYEHMGNNILWDLQHTMQKERNWTFSAKRWLKNKLSALCLMIFLRDLISFPFLSLYFLIQFRPVFPNLLETRHIFHIRKITQHTSKQKCHKKHVDNFSPHTRFSRVGSVCPQYIFFAFFWPLLMLGPSSCLE